MFHVCYRRRLIVDKCPPAKGINLLSPRNFENQIRESDSTVYQYMVYGQRKSLKSYQLYVSLLMTELTLSTFVVGLLAIVG